MRYIKTPDKCEEFFHLFLNYKISGFRQKNDLKLAAFSQFTLWVTTNFKSFFCVQWDSANLPLHFFLTHFLKHILNWIPEPVKMIVKASRETRN